MASTINAQTSPFAAVVTTADSSGVLGIQTGGTTALTIDTSQNVGIGTTSPGYKLDVSSSSSLYTRVISTGAGTYAGNVYTSYSGGGTATTFAAYSDGNNGYGVIGTQTNQATTFITNNTERMRVDTSGNVGIGTSSPTTRLTISGSTLSGAYGTGYEIATRIGQSSDGASNADVDMRRWTGSGTNHGTGRIATNDSASMIFYTDTKSTNTFATTERMRIDSSGNVGIGTTSPNNTRLHVIAGSSGNGSGPIKLEGYNVYNTGFMLYNGATQTAAFGTKAMLISGATDEFGIFANGTANTLLLGTNTTERMRIDSSGNVGVNNTSPTDTAGYGGKVIDVLGPVYARQYTDSTKYFSCGVSGGQAYLEANGSGVGMIFYTANSEQARLTSAGLLQFNSGYGSVATAYGCRAWVNFNGTGTVAIRASGNVSSITDNGTGDYTVTFSSSMPDTSYATTASARHSAGALSTFISVQTVGLGSVRIQNYNSGGALYDDDTISVVIQR